MANRNWASGGKIYSMHVSPVMIDGHFTVAATAALGISALKGPAVSAVYGHSTHATPSSYNPAAGTFLIQLADNYSGMFASLKAMIMSPLSGSDVKIDNSAMTAGVAYTISIVGDATAAKWHAVGVPAGITPAVGVSFIALNTGTGSNALTSRVQASATNGSGIASIEILNPALQLAPNPSSAQGYGAYAIIQCYDYAGAKANPADGSILSFSMYLSNSSITVQGE